MLIINRRRDSLLLYIDIPPHIIYVNIVDVLLRNCRGSKCCLIIIINMLKNFVIIII